MKVIKRIKSTGQLIKTEYPAIWGTLVYKLDDNLEFFEIKQLPIPEFNSHQYTAVEKLTITENIGEFLPICEVGFELIEKSKESVLNDFNTLFGNFIDENYPLWQRIKDISNPSENGALRLAKEAELRSNRDSMELDYIDNDIFPNFNFEWL